MNTLNNKQIVVDNIINYSHAIDLDYLVNIVNNLSFAEFENIICQLLKSLDREIVNATCFAIRDLIVCGSRYKEFDEFAEKYPQSLIVKSIEDLLFSPNRNTVNDAIYTLGKTCSYNSISALKKAFYKLKDTDPLLLERLFCEMQWLGGLEKETTWEFLDALISSDRYITRWTTLYLIPECIEEDGTEISILQHEKYYYLQSLKEDSSLLIRAQAEYRCEEIEFNLISQTLTKQERKKQRKQLEKKKSSILTLDDIEGRFSSYIYRKKLSSYTMSELETFVEHFYFFIFNKLPNVKPHNEII